MTKKFGELKAASRTQAGKGAARKLRAQGLIPAILYGKGEDNKLLSIDPLALRRCMDPERKLNTFFTVKIDGEKDEQCIITDCQLHPTRDQFVHVDFLRVDSSTDINTTVPVTYSGKAVGTALGGTLRTYRRSVRIAVRPNAIPVSVNVDVTSLEGGTSLRLKSMQVAGVRLLDHPETVMAHVDMPRGQDGEGGENADAETPS